MEDKLIIFEDKKIRRIWFNEEWYYSVVDIIEVLVEASIPRRYWSDLKAKMQKDEGFELYDFIVQLKLEASDGKKYVTDCANTKSIFRIIQSIPSKRVEPFKQWFAQLGEERLDEIQNPSLAVERSREYYRTKGYPKAWIDKEKIADSLYLHLKDGVLRASLIRDF
ncbi:MAG: BRO family protein [Nanoarchaeota archaeon]